MLWEYDEPSAHAVATLSSKLGLKPVVAQLLVARGWQEPERAHDFLNPSLSRLEDPFALTHMDKAVDRLVAAMGNGESILIIGDYDVDGVTSTTLLVRLLRRFGIFPRFMVPRRLEEGYGLSAAVVERVLAGDKPDLLFALDCGTNSVDEVAQLVAHGVDVIVIDHHRSKEALPKGAILVNPHVFDAEEAPWKDLCTVGLVFKLVHALVKRLRQAGDEVAAGIRLRDELDLVALGTVSDLVPLTGENRILTSFGLRCLQQKSARPGLVALLQVSGLEPGQPIDPLDIAFRLGPRINASGRLADATLPVEMLLNKNYSECLQAARQLDAYNRERQEIERAIYEEALAQVEATQREASGLIVYGENWHPGVLGIVAGKIARAFNRPCIALGPEGAEFAKGSGRSIEGINLQQVLTRCDELLLEWGGHPMAVGLSLRADNIDALRMGFSSAVEHASEQGGEDTLSSTGLKLAAWVDAAELNAELLEQLDTLQPFGQGNEQPLFGVRTLRLERPVETFSDGQHIRFTLPESGTAVIGWRMGEKAPPHKEKIELVVRFGWNRWNGRVLPQAELVSWRPAAK